MSEMKQSWNEVKSALANPSQVRCRLGKRLSYLLRYGAEKEGLKVQEGGYICLDELMQVPMMRWHKHDAVLAEIDGAISYRGGPRYERKQHNLKTFVRAKYGISMERNPCHEDSGVPRLLVQCMDTVCNNLGDYDLTGFPDEYILNTMLHRLKRQKRLSTGRLKALLVDTIEHLDLSGMYLTEGGVKAVGTGCPNLRHLSLREGGYLVTDHLLTQLVKKLPRLESFNLSWCWHLTDKSLTILNKHCPNIQHVYLTGIQNLSQPAIIDYITHNPNLQYIDVYDNKNIDSEGREVLSEIMVARDGVILLKGLDEDGKCEASDDSNTSTASDDS